MAITTTIEDPLFEMAYCYDGTFEGLLSAIFKAYEFKEDPTDVCPEQRYTARLGQGNRTIQTDNDLAKRVAQGIIRTCGAETFEFIKKASLVDDKSTGTDVYRFVRFAMKTGRSAMHQLAHPLVHPLAQRNKFIYAESERVRQFVRFKELENGLFFATISPKANVVPLIMNGFAARFNTQPFIIFDPVHQVAGVYEGPRASTDDPWFWGNSSWYLVPVDSYKDLHIPGVTPDEILMQDAWRRFYQATTIACRYHPELRAHFIPRRFWKDLPELQQQLPGLTPLAGQRPE